jgi:hypothetical protein
MDKWGEKRSGMSVVSWNHLFVLLYGDGEGRGEGGGKAIRTALREIKGTK